MKYVLFVLLVVSGVVCAQDGAVGFASVAGDGLDLTTGGAGGVVVLVETLSDLKKYAGSTDDPYVIVIHGEISSLYWTEVRVNSNKTIVGYGDDATLSNIELQILQAENVIIRNLTIRDSYVEGDWEGKTNDFDAIQVDDCHHLWIDHCLFTHCGDGLLDLRDASDLITVSWVHFSHHNKVFGIGWTDEVDWRVTIHHCWFDDVNQRNPSFDQGIGHLYNNYLSNISGYGNLSRGNAQLVIQNSVFEDVLNPLSISDNGKLFSSGNSFDGCVGSQDGNVIDRPFDPADYYDFFIDETVDVKNIVTQGVGPKKDIGDQYIGSLSNYSFSTSVVAGEGSVTLYDGDYLAGISYLVEATPADGWVFDHWSGDATGSTNGLYVLLDHEKEVFAHFKEAASSGLPDVKGVEWQLGVYDPLERSIVLDLGVFQVFSVNVYSLQGVKLFSKSGGGKGEQKLFLEGLPFGVYVFRIEVAGCVTTEKRLLF